MKYFVSVLFMFLFVFSGAQAQNSLPEDFDATVLENMKKWHAPGLGLAIVRDGQTVLAKGYGVKSFKTMEPVNENTLFQAGSTTKAFAAMSIAMLIDQGKANWDDPVIKYIPEFRMEDKYVQNHLTIRDALSHRSGVSYLSNLNLFFGKNLSETWDMMSNNGQQASFREKWDYNNTTFALSGKVVERISGLPFHEFVRQNILEPLGMKNSVMLDEEVRTSGNRAQAHQHYEGTDYEIPYPYIEYTKSAGMLNSTPVDMTKWMKFLLAKGVWEGKRLVSEEHIEEMLKPQMLLEPKDIYPAAASYNHNYYAYGLAWFVHDYKGQKIAMHTGSIDGMVAIIGILPEQNIGVYVFINSDHIEYRHALMYSVIDILLNNERTNWSEKLYQVYHPENGDAYETAMAHPDIKSEDLIGTYKLKGTYPLIIKEIDGVLKGYLGIQVTEIEQQSDGRFLLIDPETREIPRKNFLTVTVNEDGDVKNVSLSGMTFEKQ